jgi:hypothetical protein
LVLAHGRAERPNEAEALQILGEIAATRAEDELAMDYNTRALDLAIELGMRPLVAHCHLGLAKLHERAGRIEQAREQLSIARSLYREMNIPLCAATGRD